MSPERSPGARYLALGDSYTIGEGVEAGWRWPEQLVVQLRRNGIAVADPGIIATTGWTTDELATAIDAAEPPQDHDMVSLLIGVNDQYRGRPLDQLRTEFNALLDRATGLAGGDRDRVFAVSIPDWGVTAFASDNGHDAHTVAAAIDACNDIARTACATRSIAFIDITDLTRAHPAEVVADGLHPSAAQYSRWIDRIEPVARSLLLRSA